MRMFTYKKSRDQYTLHLNYELLIFFYIFFLFFPFFLEYFKIYAMMEATQMSISRQLDKKAVVHIHNGLFSSVAQSCLTLCDPMNHSTPGFPVHHQLPEFTQTHIHRVADAIRPSHPLSSPSPPAPNPSQHQSLFQ